MGKKFRLTAWILAVSILLNMVPLPASSQENAAATQTNTEEIIQTGNIGSDPTGDTGSDPTGDTGSDPTDDTGSDLNGGTGSDLNGGTDSGLIVGDDSSSDEQLIMNSSEDDDQTGNSDEEMNTSDEIMSLEGESGQWESLSDWEDKCSEGKYNKDTGLVIDSGWDLICLSNIEPSLYRDKKLVLTNPNLDTTTCPEVADPSLAFQGLGTDAEPFVGIVEYGAGNEATITLNRPLFNRLSFQENTSLCTLYLKSSQNTTALLADTVDGNGAIQVVLENPVASEDVSAVLPPVFQTINKPDGVESTNIQISVTNRAEVGVTGNGLICNTLDTNAQLTVTGITNYLGLTAESGDAGGLVGTMKDGSILQVGDSAVSGETAGSTAIEISNVSGAATGGLVGTMKGTATVNVNAAVTVSSISGSNAGGLVGSMASNATLNAGSGSLILKDAGDTKAVTGSSNAGGCVGFAEDIVFSIPTITVDSSATVYGTGSAGVGGLIGAYTYSGTADRFSNVSQISIPGLTLACTGDNGKAGALFGKLSNNGVGTFSISDVTVDGVSFQNGSAGGLIGQYGTTDLSAALEISGATVETSLKSNARDYGGLIGVDDCGSPAYIKIYGNTTVTMNSGGTPTDFGGLVSRLQGDNAGHLLNLEGTVTVNVTGNFKSSASTGGLVAYLPNGVIRIGGNVTINGTLAPEENNRYRSGWVVGDLGNALVYVDQSVEGAGLTLADKESNSNQYNDLGRWGQVLEANDSTDLPGLLEFNETNHTVTVAETNANGSYQITNLKEFATVALRLQLNQIDTLVIGGDISSPVDITIGQDITLSNGLFGLQRDHSGSEQFNVTIHGGGKKITLPNTTVYPTGESHNRLGLLSNVSALTAENLTVAGEINFDQSSGSIYAGGLAAFAAGDVTLTNVTGAANITGSGSMGSDELSGLIAHVGDGTTLKFTDCSWTSTITDSGTSTDVYIGGFLGKGTNVGMSVSSGTLGSSTRSGTIRKNNATTAKAGGLVASLSGRTLDIDGLTISNASIDAPRATGTCGGLLSYELLDTTTNIAGVTIANSSVNAGSAGFGGLVYKASGVMTIEKNADDVGVSIGTGNSFAGGSSESAPSGLLVCRGDQQDANDKALYLKVLDGAYSVDSLTRVTLSGTYFDELVGITKGAYGNGIVSYATPGNALIDQSDCNTYQQKIANGGTIWDNPCTRYYYNLDSFDPADGDITSAGELVMWSVSQYCADELKSNFATGGSFVISGDIPLAGYSYYPVSPRDGVSIDGATITFAYKDLVDKELRTGSDVENKKPSNSARQHYLMHTGIFENVINQSLSVNNLTLSGTVGPVANGSGALISGSISSNRDAGSKTLTINSLTLNNLTIYGGNTSDYAPLLINKIGSYVTMNMDGVSTTGYDTQTTAATSLIGNVGDATSGTDIRLTFSNMALDAKTDGLGNPDYYGSQGAIFSHATFLESFAYSDKTTCFGEYNFTVAEGDPKYTVGVEVSNTSSGRNLKLQYKDEAGSDYVKYPGGTAPANDEGAADWFKVAEYRRYVNHIEDDTNHYYELDINQRPKDLTKGCGTYGDPYVIEYASQLAAVAKIIRGESVYDWSVRMNDQVLNGDFGDQNGHGPNPIDAIDINYKLARGADKWNGSLENDKVRDYLRNAYYQISDDLNLSSTWGGLGSEDMPFMGVIVGKKTGETCPRITITATQAKQYGGLIKFSEGSVVKNLKIEFSGSATVLDAGVLSDAAFFGGVVGWCHGGDTIIDNVSVNLSAPSISGSNGKLAAVGGYVGLVGGYDASTGGGVVFKGTIGSGLSGVTVGKDSISATSSDGNYFYVNPYVGRVLDGYAVYDSTESSEKLDNTNKNYQIPTISGNNHLTWADSTLTVKDAAGLWLLSAIVNSGSTGKARSCDYDAVGTALAEGNNSSELNDEKRASKPYLVEKFTSDKATFPSLTSQSSIRIEMDKDCDMTGYGNGFRGIGTSYSNERLLNVGFLDGQNQKVILNQNRREYTAESGKWVSRGAGLFTQLNLSGSLAVSNLTLCGQTGITYEKNANVKYDSSNYPGAGLLVGLLKSTGKHSVSLDNVSLAKDDNDAAPKVVGTAANAGGLIGYYNASGTNVTLTDCDCSNVTVTGGMNAGGLVGYFTANSATVSYSATKKTLTDINVTANTASGLSGSGGLIGVSDQTVLTIGGDNRLTIRGLTVKYGTSADASDNLNSGGLVGLWRAKQNTDAVIQNVSLEGKVTIAGGSNVGGLTGALLHDASHWNDGGGIKPTITGVYIAQEKDSNVTIIRGRQLGALIGVMKASGEANIWDIRVGSSESTVVVANNSEVTSNNADAHSIGGLFGIVLVPTLTMSSVQMTGVKVLVRHSKMRGAGVIFGHIESDGTVRMANVLMDQCEAVIDGNKPIGLIAGLLKNNGVKVYGTDILARDCTVGVALKYVNNKYSATTLTNSEESSLMVPTYDAVGLSNGTYQPYSELATYDRDKLANYKTPSNMGIWFGDAQNKAFKLVGASIVLTKGRTASLPVKDVGTNPGTNNYIIRSNYLGVDVVDETKMPVEVHATDKPKTNCDSLPMVDEKNLTGDGVYFFDKEAKKSVANAILADYSGKNWKRIGLNSDVATDIVKIQTGENYFSLTTFASTKSKASGTSIIPDFPVLKITAKDAKTINEVVDAYISVLTNTYFSHTSDANGKVQAIANCPYTIEATTYVWNGSVFEQTAVGTLRVVNDNVLQSNGGSYDCDKDQFTLLDVKFADPKNTDAIAYHLYIPVAIEKKLEYNFWAAAQVGTSYNAEAYSNLKDVVIGSHHEPVTVMIGFEYPRKKAEWQSAVDSGENLLWSLDKVITLTDAKNDAPTPLPDGTELILVDRGTMADAGQKDRAYTATVNIKDWEWKGNECKLAFKKFTAMDGSGEFQARDFCDELNLTATQDNKNGTFVETDKGQATLRAQLNGESKYFRLATTGETGQKYSVTVGISEPLSEQYYLTIRTPKVTAETSPINYFTVSYNNPTYSGRMPTELIPWANDRYYAKNKNENQIILSNFFKQTFTITAEPSDANPVEAKTGDDVKSRSNIVATLKTQIEFESEAHATTFKQYINDRPLYQCFDLSLVEVVNEVQSNKPIVKGAQIAVNYGDGSGSWVEGGTISLTQPQESVRLIGSSTGYTVGGLNENSVLTMEAMVYLAYDAAGIVEQFPTRSSGLASTNGIQIRGSSSLAYSQEALSNSFIRENSQDTDHTYYRKSDSAATMSYSARDNAASAPGDSVSQLGINGLEDNFPIQSLGVYNVERVEGASSAKYLKCTVSLYCKDNLTNQYTTPVTGSIGSYLPELKLGLDITDAGGNIAHTDMTAPSGDGSVIFTLPQTFDPGSFIEIPVEMKVLTGEAFEAEGYRYANYQVRLTARLLDEAQKEIDNSEASDYIVYTNAKILRELIFQQTSG
ncbi:MAG: hypothetical protein MSH58_09550 [Clostridiales bacterium]|nr:hypothetical protein [Clostridiales bacterium]